MAKRRRVTDSQKAFGSRSSSDPSDSLDAAPVNPLAIALGALGGALVYVMYHPSDSVAVEQGDALWFGLLSLVIAIATWVFTTSGNAAITDDTQVSARYDRLLDAIPWALAAWMMIAALATSPPGNLRMATNEAWLWVSAAALFTAARRLVVDEKSRRVMLLLLVVCAAGLAVHALHQQWISLPANRAEYERDPDRVVRLAGVDAPAGSAERMVFANRLLDGGPTATFALANSLAAVLLTGVVIGFGLLRFTWPSIPPWQRAVWIGVLLICVAALIAARSRSATLAMLIGVGWVLVARRRGRSLRMLLAGFSVAAVTGAIGAMVLALLGNPEWFEQAPASLSFRLQYWRATWRMMLDRPWFGSGPGNYQALYDRYREASTAEQIAEPHNFLFETLASGGPIALMALLVLIYAGIRLAMRRQVNTQQEDAAVSIREGDRWLWLGASVALALVWLIGWASRHAPDFSAHLFAVPIAVALATILASSVATLRSQELDAICQASLLSLAIHLSVSGGWTVPGVAMIVWILAAMLTRRVVLQKGTSRMSFLAGSIGLALLASLSIVSLRPVQQQRRLMATAEMAQAAGQLARARISLEQAVAADPWSAASTLWLADFYRWKLILESNTSEARQRWTAALEETKRRAGESPSVYRQVGAQQLHLYQKYGASEDLEAAAETFEQAARWSPSDQWIIAQLSEIARAVGDSAEAEALASRAKELSELGGNIERGLWLQQIYVAEPIGSSADRQPIRNNAEDLLFHDR